MRAAAMAVGQRQNAMLIERCGAVGNLRHVEGVMFPFREGPPGEKADRLVEYCPHLPSA